jgi:LmbE family N-acetylglucosaminyl deacetylase
MDLKTLVSAGKARDISKLTWPDALRILMLAPHPDDFDAVGVTLKFFSRQGHSVRVAVVRTGSGVEDTYRPDLTLEDKANLREHEQRRSLHFFGLPETCLTFLTLSNDAEDQPVDSPENASAIEAVLGQEVPDIVVLPHGNDTNSGHRVMYSLLTQAAQRSGQPLAAFLDRDPKTIGLRTDLYMPFGQDEGDWKAALLRFHDSQHQRNLNTRGHGFDDRILDVNRAIAHELSLTHEYAEAFEIELHNIVEK